MTRTIQKALQFSLYFSFRSLPPPVISVILWLTDLCDLPDLRLHWCRANPVQSGTACYQQSYINFPQLRIRSAKGERKKKKKKVLFEKGFQLQEKCPTSYCLLWYFVLFTNCSFLHEHLCHICAWLHRSSSKNWSTSLYSLFSGCVILSKWYTCDDWVYDTDYSRLDPYWCFWWALTVLV